MKLGAAMCFSCAIPAAVTSCSHKQNREMSEGDGKNLYYGNDMIECAVQKFFKKENAVELVPYMCALDYPASKLFKRGLVRTKTLVESDVCDFRYMIDHETQINLPPGLKV